MTTDGAYATASDIQPETRDDIDREDERRQEQAPVLHITIKGPHQVCYFVARRLREMLHDSPVIRDGKTTGATVMVRSSTGTVFGPEDANYVIEMVDG